MSGRGNTRSKAKPAASLRSRFFEPERANVRGSAAAKGKLTLGDLVFVPAGKGQEIKLGTVSFSRGSSTNEGAEKSAVRKEFLEGLKLLKAAAAAPPPPALFYDPKAGGARRRTRRVRRVRRGTRRV